MIKYIIIALLMINIGYGACVDMGVMQATAQSLKNAYKMADKAVEQIIKQIKSDEDSVSDNNDTSLTKLENIQNLDSKNTLNAQSIFFNAKMINDLQSNIIDSKGERASYILDKELEEILK